MVCLDGSNGGRSSWRLAALATLTSFLLFTSPVTSQTWSSCNPTKQSGCPADPALARSVSVDFTSGASNEFTASGNPTYSKDGAAFTVAAGGQAPTLTSKWYIMYGKYSVTMKASPGVGIISSLVLQSDDLDEIDWEWLGGKPNEVQSNYFGKGQTTTYNRGAFHAVTDTQSQWHTYSVEWTSTQIVWSIDGSTVRVLNAAAANGQFPQSPMQLKLGSWSGGDPSNSAGTIEWAGGVTNYAAGPYTMYVKSLSVVDYSTGSSYSYSDMSGSAGSIVAAGGRVGGNSGGSVTDVQAPAITNTSPGGDTWDGTHRTNTATVSYTSYEGLPSGWVVTSSGKVRPPSGAATSTPPPSPSSALPPSSPSSSPAQPPLPSCAPSSPETPAVTAYITTTAYDDHGFLTTATIAVGVSAASTQSACASQETESSSESPSESPSASSSASSSEKFVYAPETTLVTTTPTIAVTTTAATIKPTVAASAYSSAPHSSMRGTASPSTTTTATTTTATGDGMSNAIMSGISGPAPLAGAAAPALHADPAAKLVVIAAAVAGAVLFMNLL